ncbi:MAG: transposase [Dehalococcoidia bacterium]
MPTLPSALIAMLAPFAPRCSRRVWPHAQGLLAGALLAPAQRTVTAALRVMGLAQLRQFQRYQRVRSRDHWASLAAGRMLLRLLVAAFVPDGPLVFGIDATIERRRGCRGDAHAGAGRSPLASMRRSSAAAAASLPPRAATATRCVPARGSSSTPADCAGSACCCSSPSPGRGGSGRCRG